MNATLSSAARSMRGSLQGADAAFDGVSIDTRTLRDGELFFALAGPNFNGCDFIDLARDKGAAGAVVTDVADTDLSQITVADTRLALGQLGAAWRASHSVTVVAVTGSNGKTTLKEMIAACLVQEAPTLATIGNLNNDIGMPLMLLRIAPVHQYAVLEMGANHSGEIAYLTSLASPDIVCITNAGSAHLEGFGSIEGVAHAKGEILAGTPRPRVAVLNADDDYFGYWCSLVDDIELLSFGFSDQADIRADKVVVEKGRTLFRLHFRNQVLSVVLPLAGVHNVRNACAAAAVATALDVAPENIVAALESVRPIAGRLQPLQGRQGATLYDDSYNANPLSVIAAGEFLASLPGESSFILGDMKELGDDEQVMHREVGEGLRNAGIDHLFVLGDLSRGAAETFGAGAHWFASIEKLIAVVQASLSPEMNVLVKGSRSMRMERVVDALRVPEKMRREA